MNMAAWGGRTNGGEVQCVTRIMLVITRIEKVGQRMKSRSPRWKDCNTATKLTSLKLTAAAAAVAAAAKKFGTVAIERSSTYGSAYCILHFAYHCTLQCLAITDAVDCCCLVAVVAVGGYRHQLRDACMKCNEICIKCT